MTRTRAFHYNALRRFPPNSGDLNPIETVWAWLRRDLGKRELADPKAKRPDLTDHQFKQRCAQILLLYVPDSDSNIWSRTVPTPVVSLYGAITAGQRFLDQCR